MGQHDIARRVAKGLAHPLQYDQRRGCGPARRQRQRWDRRHLQDVAEDSDGPEPSGRVSPASRDQPQAVSHELAEARDEAHGGGAGAEQGEVGAKEAPGPFVGEVGEEAEHADEQHEADRRPPRRRTIAWLGMSEFGHRPRTQLGSAPPRQAGQESIDHQGRDEQDESCQSAERTPVFGREALETV